MHSKALTLASLFSYSPNHKGYCGRDSAVDVFTRCILKGECEKVPRELKHFIVLCPYLKTIATLTRSSPFDYKVIEAYWMGNELIADLPLSGYEILLQEFTKQGVSSWLIESLQKKKPKRFIPNHLFQVLHVGVGQASGSVPFNIKSVNSCMIRWGKVLMVKADGTVTASLKQLTQSGVGYKLKTVKITLSADSSPFFKPKVGDTIAVHWGHIVKRLTREEETNLTYWTGRTLASVQ